MNLTNSIEWKDGVSGGTPLTAQNLNSINKGTKIALSELESEIQTKITAVQNDVAALKNGLENGDIIVGKSNNDGKGSNIEGTYAKQGGSYDDLTVGKAKRDSEGNDIREYYQPKLTFDAIPSEGSNNPVTSAGVKNYVDPDKENCETGNNMTVENGTIGSQFIIKTDVYFEGVLHQKIQYFGNIVTNASTFTLTCPDGFGPTFTNVSISYIEAMEAHYEISKTSFVGNNKISFYINKETFTGGEIGPDWQGTFSFVITTIK